MMCGGVGVMYELSRCMQVMMLEGSDIMVHRYDTSTADTVLICVQYCSYLIRCKSL